MLVLVWLFSLVMMLMRKRSYAASAEKITARSGDAVLLSSDLQGTDLEAGQDFRWTHPKVMVSMKYKEMMCHHKRCELLRNGSLRFSQVLPEDSGNYSLQVFSKTGDRLQNKVFLLTVEAGGSSTSTSSSSSSVLVSVLICCFLLLLFFIMFFMLMRRRRSQMTKTTTDQPAENVYVVMQGNRSNETKDAEKQEKEEESHYVVCNPAVSKETPITQQMSVDVEDIYV